MNKMNLPNLTYYKTCVINYNKKEYYLHHRSLLSCIKNILEEIDSKEIANFPNEAYGNLMELVTKHKLNNASGNAIIKFFNKYTKLATSPLPKSIKQGREYMDKMNLPNLTYYKTCVINYNRKEYYLHHLSLLSCIKTFYLFPIYHKTLR